MEDRRTAEAIAATRREIARRIARLCTSLSPEEFDKLLDRMAGIQWKYEILPIRPGGPTVRSQNPDSGSEENPKS